MRGEPLKYHEDKMEKSSKQPNKYCCKLCDKSFIQSRNLKSHIKNVHQGIIFKCSLKRFCNTYNWDVVETILFGFIKPTFWICKIYINMIK